MVILQALVEGFLNAGVFALVAIGLTLIFGVMKIVNFAHANFLMLAMYASYFSFTILGIHPYIGSILIVVLMLLVGAIFYKGFLKKVHFQPETNQILLTLGVSLILENLALMLFSPDVRSITSSIQDVSYQIGVVSVRMSTFWAFIVGIGLSLIFYYILKYTDFGRLIRASSQQIEAAKLVGVNVEKILLISTAIGFGLLGVAASWLLPNTSVTPFVGTTYLLPAFIIVILGGLGSIRGALLGAILYSLSDSLGSALLPGSLGLVVPLILFILVLIFKPEGFFRGAI